MSKKHIILSTIFLSFFSFSTFAEGNESEIPCNYETEIEVCVSANAWWAAREVSAFVCPTTPSIEEIAYQVVLDMKFKEIDKKMDEYIGYLDENKDLYFWPTSQKNVLDGINEIEAKFGDFWEFRTQYNMLCSATNSKWIITETIACLEDQKTTNVLSKDFFSESFCEKVYLHKLEVYKMTAYRILQLNKSQVRKDNKKEFFQERRTKYDALYDAMMVNLGYLERVWRKWKSKIKYN